MSDLSALQPGAIFGRDFRIVRPLRAGGMGSVYVVEQLSTGKPRALKVMSPELAQSQAARERFVLEARAASRIESDHVVEIVTAGVDEATGAPFIVMELLKGEELDDAVNRIGPLPLGDTAEVMTQVPSSGEVASTISIAWLCSSWTSVRIARPSAVEVPSSSSTTRTRMLSRLD